jgi:hypothetical protein
MRTPTAIGIIFYDSKKVYLKIAAKFKSGTVNLRSPEYRQENGGTENFGLRPILSNITKLHSENCVKEVKSDNNFWGVKILIQTLILDTNVDEDES